MIVHDRDIVRVAVLPPKADAPLIVDANAVLASAIALELFESIAGRNAEIFELFRRVDGHKLAQHGPLEVGREPSDGLASEQTLRIPVGEALDHPG